MVPRKLTPRILEALADTPVVLVNGARQTGKSTLVRWLLAEKRAATYVTLDDATILNAAIRDPVAFVSAHRGPLIIDEIQQAPDLLRAIKLEVDRRRVPGRFLLTGSADVFLVPRVSETLTGRIEILTLWPFSQGELQGTADEFIDAVFARPVPPRVPPVTRPELLERVLAGGYPEAVARTADARRSAWFAAYVTTLIQRDVRALADIERRTELPRLLTLLAAQSGSLLNMAELARSTGVAGTTLRRYLGLLEASFLVQTLPAWSGNVRKRLIRAPKITLIDSGLMAHVLGLDRLRLQSDPRTFGPLLESFAVQEIRKQMTWSRTRTTLFYYRTAAGREVDLVLEDAAGRIVGIEVKASATIGGTDWRGLHDLAETAGRRFHRGIMLYLGEQSLPCAPNLYLMPVSALWQLGT
ncbi:MAG TPA: ATP-binding protein [Phycisphaerae bacterium]|jgi:hypothetical protein